MWWCAKDSRNGCAVRADGQSATIVGIMPKGFAFPERQEAWMALQTDPLSLPRGSGPTQLVYGRLRAGVTREMAQADLGTIAARLARQFPDTNRNLVPVVRLYTETMGSDDEDAVFFMVLIVGLGFGVLLVGCANVSNLLLARAVARARDTALRAALGAGRRRLVTQMLAETAVLVAGEIAVGLAAGGFLAVALARASRAMLFHVQPGDLATYAVIVATLAIAAATAAWRPVRHAIRVDPAVALRNE
jgi:putative ABC transport system permease protein